MHTRHDLLLSTPARAIPHSSSDQYIISMGFTLHHTALPFAACCPPDLFIVASFTIRYPARSHIIPLCTCIHSLTSLSRYCTIIPVCIAAICNEPVDVYASSVLQHFFLSTTISVISVLVSCIEKLQKKKPKIILDKARRACFSPEDEPNSRALMLRCAHI